MGCCKTKIDLCYLVQETYASPTFNFKDIDVSLDTFIYKTNKLYTCSDERVFEVDFIDNNTVYIVDVDLPISEYNHELIWIRNGIETVVFQGKLTITNKANNCGCGNNKFTFEVINEDVVISVDFEERIIERITDKGPQGDSAYQVAVENGFVGTESEWLESLKLHYSDLTEAEILELQQPAIEAAQTANTAADNANTATQNAITATNEANTATVNANNAANNANTSATNADDSADLATSAATNANNAATSANNAAAFANSQRGWTPIHEFESDGSQRQVKKLTDYIGGTGDKPTQNIGEYVIDGGYTTDKSLATNFKGKQSDNLILEYVHSGNKEVYIDSIDYDTNTFVSAGHELVNGDRLGLNLLKQIDNINQSPFTKLPVNTMVSRGFDVVNITTDTFQIATTNGGNPITLINQSTLDLSFFRFEEVRSTTNLTFSNINHNNIELKIVGGFARNPRTIIFKGVGNIGFTSSNNAFSNLFHDVLWCLGGTYSVSFITNDKEEVRQRTWNLLQFNPMFNNGVLNEIIYSIDNTQNSLQIANGFYPYNGTTIKIYKL